MPAMRDVFLLISILLSSYVFLTGYSVHGHIRRFWLKRKIIAIVDKEESKLIAKLIIQNQTSYSATMLAIVRQVGGEPDSHSLGQQVLSPFQTETLTIPARFWIDQTLNTKPHYAVHVVITVVAGESPIKLHINQRSTK